MRIEKLGLCPPSEFTALLAMSYAEFRHACAYRELYLMTLGSPGGGGFLGLVNSSQLIKNKFVAIAFDTKEDLHFYDPDDNHVGLDIDSLILIKTANVMLVGIDLKSRNLISSWIDYKSYETKLMVFLSCSSSKPKKPILIVDATYQRKYIFCGTDMKCSNMI
ncbi:putative L-type lectin-domain containing receptor kinase S.7 [Capsicum baccatum]|uniref:L-type lectin-domain containing receptor kinase S.7 n=1 Tax=Capsicum baccatum TaxID=33114 RepID=A0A2G2XS01_CAPBA|nr:putative L-type lectin-domain containing receptor kinase S.7 [Capsicum baccatum]